MIRELLAFAQEITITTDYTHLGDNTMIAMRYALINICCETHSSTAICSEYAMHEQLLSSRVDSSAALRCSGQLPHCMFGDAQTSIMLSFLSLRRTC